ncbi:MAG: hypothetical protein NT076_02515 [Candidatus Pacearchaeota archaeon]|nr:hypothetical protein [Candidatus Pacearchaeota archaeon]
MDYKQILKEVREEVGDRYDNLPNTSPIESWNLEKLDVLAILLAKLLEKK